MPFVPLRVILRSKWTTLLWAGGICLSAANFAQHGVPAIDTANASETENAVSAALAAEE